MGALTVTIYQTASKGDRVWDFVAEVIDSDTIRTMYTSPPFAAQEEAADDGAAWVEKIKAGSVCNKINGERLQRFVAEYERQLTAAVTDNPEEYGYPPSMVPGVVVRMRAAFESGKYSKDGRAIKGTCKALKIKLTYTAINAYLAG